MLAAKEMKPRLLEAAGLLLGVSADKVELIDGQAWIKGKTDTQKVPFTEIVKKLYAERMQPISYGWFKALIQIVILKQVKDKLTTFTATVLT